MNQSGYSKHIKASQPQPIRPLRSVSVTTRAFRFISWKDQRTFALISDQILCLKILRLICLLNSTPIHQAAELHTAPYQVTE